MRCNPSYWLWGLIPMAVLSWVAVQLEHEGIEADLGRRAQEALSRKGLDWAVTNFSGRDGIVSGRAEEDEAPARALGSVRDTWGVRVVYGQTELLDRVERFLWSANSHDNRVTLTGFVPSEELRRAVVTAAHAEFPKAEIVDETKLARGAPARELWMSGVSFGLKQLAQLKKGSIDLSALDLSVVGEAATSPAYKSVKAALATGMPSGVKLALEKITAPVANPFIWSAKSQGNQLVMSGFVPSDKAREELIGLAKKAYPKFAVVDRMETADGAADGFVKAAATALSGLAQLKTGEAAIKAKDLNLAGEANDEGIANTVRGALKSDVPAAFKVTEQIKYPKANGPYVTSVVHDGKSVVLSGLVPSEAARVALIDAAKTRFPGAQIADKLQIAGGAPDGWQQCVVAGLNAMPRLSNGKSVLTDRRLLVSGVTDDAAVAQGLPGEIKNAAGQGCETATDIAYSGLAWHARHGEDGSVVFEGEVPDEAARTRLHEAAAQIFPQAKITDQTKVTPGAAEPWTGLALRGLQQLARLKRGEATLSGHELTLSGFADSEALAGDVRGALARDLPQGYAARDAIEVKKLEIIQEADKCQDLLSEAANTGVINFGRASADLTPESTLTLNELAQIANACPSFRIEIGGHTDAEGTPERNQHLSERRANAVSSFLTMAGVDANRLTAVGYGETRPIADNRTAQGRARNRRIEFTVKVN
jgi:OOP family OmpA-OmpF porin